MKTPKSMKSFNLLSKISMLMAIALLGFVSSCKNDEVVLSQDAIDVTSETQAEASFEDAEDISQVVVYDYDNPSGGRVAGTDSRLCNSVVITAEGTMESGQITIDFGTGCTDPRGNVRKGKIILNYSGGPRGTEGFAVVTTFDGYSINDIKLEGTRTVTLASIIEGTTEISRSHNIVLTGGKATWPDNTFATRSASFTRKWTRGINTHENDRAELSGGAEGTNRKGNAYSMNIDANDPLLYKRACGLEGIHMAVAGTKTFTRDGKTLTIDFGDGDCDRIVTFIANGTSRDVTVGKN